jgi:hypothetical protein
MQCHSVSESLSVVPSASNCWPTALTHVAFDASFDTLRVVNRPESRPIGAWFELCSHLPDDLQTHSRGLRIPTSLPTVKPLERFGVDCAESRRAVPRLVATDAHLEAKVAERSAVPPSDAARSKREGQSGWRNRAWNAGVLPHTLLL